MTNEPLHTAPPPPPPPMGFPTAPPPGYPPAYGWAVTSPRDVGRGQSIAALVLGCCSLVFYFTLIVPALAIVFASVAMRRQRVAGSKLNGMAIAGLVLGIAFLLLGVIFVLAYTAA